MTIGGLLFAILVVIAAYTLGRLHERQRINDKLRTIREVDFSALLDDLTQDGNGLSRPAETARTKDRPVSFTSEGA